MRRANWFAASLLSTLLLMTSMLWASITGSISGVITDSSGAVVAGANVTATDTQTGTHTTVVTDSKGFYNFPSLAVGNYTVEISRPGFKQYRTTDLVVNANSALRLDAALVVGAASEKVEVTSEAVHVETQSTQMGEVITGKTMTAVPLNGRAFTDLLALQPGVSPYNSSDTGMAGVNDRPVDGGLNSGNQSVNGQREASNGFMVNGSNVEEGKTNGAAIIPNLDSISEFRIITNNYDAEYGNYSGGQINVVTKSGTNALHGTVFDFLRNTSLDAKNYFAAHSDPTPVFRQNQFGGTIGGAIKKNSTFFFVDYQGTRQTLAPTVTAQVPTVDNLGGNFSDSADSFSGVVNGPYFANLLSQRLGYNVNDQEPYYTAGCTNATQCVFPNADVPKAAWSPVATAMVGMGLIPQPNVSTQNFNYETSQYAQTLRDDKGGVRIDQNWRFGQLFGYYFADDYLLDSPFPSGGASVPAQGFPYSATTSGRAQLVNIGDTKSFGATAVNEFRFSYVRNTLSLTTPTSGIGSNFSLANLGFVTPWGAASGGISPIAPGLEGVPYITFNSFGIGVPQVSTRQYNNSFQWLDNFSKVIGTHSLKFGGQFHYDQINERNLAAENGQYGFSGSETGIDFADFLIGAPDSLTQASPQILDSRSKYYALFAQDSWRVTPNLVFNYGLRWEASMPWYDTQNKTETIIPGKQSVKFPGAPPGYVVAGDPGVPRTLAPTQWANFSPRLGLAYSPSATSGFWAKVFGGPGRTSIRIGGGLYYTSVEDLSQFLEVGDPPYGLYYGSANPPLLEAPYLARYSGDSVGQRFPFPYPPTNVSPSNPDSTFPWAQVEPLSYDWSFNSHNKLPYSEHYELSLQRQIGADTVVTASYVGNQAHRLVAAVESNPTNQAACLFLSDSANLGPNSAGPCGPFSETPPFTVTVVGGESIGTTTPWVTSTGKVVNSVRPLGPLFDTNPWVSTIANSNYNSLQMSANYESSSLSFLAAYTFSKCMDNASGLQDSVYPYDPRVSRALCNFDVTHNFVISYNWLLPFDKYASKRWERALIGGWALSGITSFATGLPVSLSENDDNSLIGANAAPVDVPNCSYSGAVLGDTDPRSGKPYFNTALFSPEQLGQFGNCRRRYFHGPGINNFNMALLKTVVFTESKQLQLRFEAFNVFNHAQFTNPSGEINSDTFGLVTNARDPRIMQVGAKFIF
ncbi:hypothetical protein Acid345_0428 [Candidatus Koribacter versatilis Ellin345]|uniref:TonB-dependent transporter Oar-like beta-barrel domain-containing protein n=1 Tax=Koribacter versatilis (strain Ellin345) TaxID=204669 RepID=Q1IUL7_KORVE|nr:carboxypeptidase regulatory-like domain-containing protein [Candidatus Koribacter versatilis]ABF39433.1 hypothetical protein Acid345_0428 [Candidatus Koribacter versatilis Ellin345]